MNECYHCRIEYKKIFDIVLSFEAGLSLYFYMERMEAALIDFLMICHSRSSHVRDFRELEWIESTLWSSSLGLFLSTISII